MTAKTTGGVLAFRIRGIVFAAALLAGDGLGAAAPSAVYDVKSFGAKGDGYTNDTAAINDAIQAASAAGGGTVLVPEGSYVSGSIRMKSDIELHLGPGATIVASADPQTYDAPEENEWGDSLGYQDAGHSHWHNSLIWGEDLTDVSITGPGRIFGKGLGRGVESDRSAQGIGNKAIALKNCRNVILRDVTIEHGGWFGILATGVDNLTIDGLKIDTNRDGMDIDCCVNVRISKCSVNSPKDDGICLKSSFALGQARSTENVTISDCLVSGYDEGTMLDGTRKHTDPDNPAPTGRIKFGTESNGGFKAITIVNCQFECSRGLALESVDGALLEDVVVSNLTMRRIFGAPLFLRLGARMRGPATSTVGRIRHVLISNVVAEGVTGDQGILITGVPDHPIEGLTLDNIQIEFAGGGTRAQAARSVPEMENEYPEPGRFGVTPSWAFFGRHVVDLVVRDTRFRTASDDLRPPVVLEDVAGAEFDHVAAPAQPGTQAFILRKVDGFSNRSCPGVPDSPAPAGGAAPGGS
jgi:polygalacturonase